MWNISCNLPLLIDSSIAQWSRAFPMTGEDPGSSPGRGVKKSFNGCYTLFQSLASWEPTHLSCYLKIRVTNGHIWTWRPQGLKALYKESALKSKHKTWPSLLVLIPLSSVWKNHLQVALLSMFLSRDVTVFWFLFVYNKGRDGLHFHEPNLWGFFWASVLVSAAPPMN